MFFILHVMQDINQANVLEITLAQHGVAHIKRLKKVTKIVFSLGCIVSLLFLVDIYLRYANINLNLYKDYPLLYFQMLIYPAYAVIYTILFIVQLVYFLQFAIYCNRSIEYNDAEAFNSSFKLLYKYNVVAIFSLCLHIFLFSLFLATDFQALQINSEPLN